MLKADDELLPSMAVLVRTVNLSSFVKLLTV